MFTKSFGGWNRGLIAGLGLLLGWLGAGPMATHVAAQNQPVLATLSDEAHISLLTILPGDAVYSAFGHSALRVFDPVQRIDVTFNYGTFEFDAFFVPKFAYGQLDYLLWMGSYPRALRAYQQIEGRPVLEQVFRLSPAQKDTLFRFLQINALPENRTYRYDFLFDNCATRIRDVFERTLGEAFQLGEMPDPQRSFRQLIDPYLINQPLLDTGLDVLLGATMDRPATAREAQFLPDFLFDAFAAATITIDGVTQPLVVRTDTVAHVAGYERARPGFPLAHVLGWLCFAVGVGFTFYQMRRQANLVSRVDVWLFRLLGSVGVLLVAMWLLTLHHVTAENFNLLWAVPTHLWLARQLRQQTHIAAARRYLAVTLGLALVLVVGWTAWPQALPVPLLPLVLLVAVRSGVLLYGLRRV